MNFQKIIASTLAAATLAGSMGIASANDVNTEPQTDFSPDENTLVCAKEALGQVELSSREKDAVYIGDRNLSSHELETYVSEYADGEKDFTIGKYYSEVYGDNQINTMSARISFNESNQVGFKTTHDGTLDIFTKDRAVTLIHITTDGNSVIERDGSVHADDRGRVEDWVNRPHVEFTMDGAQKLEAVFGKCMDLTHSEDAQRIKGAVTAEGPAITAPDFMPAPK